MKDIPFGSEAYHALRADFVRTTPLNIFARLIDMFVFENPNKNTIRIEESYIKLGIFRKKSIFRVNIWRGDAFLLKTFINKKDAEIYANKIQEKSNYIFKFLDRVQEKFNIFSSFWRRNKWK